MVGRSIRAIYTPYVSLSPISGLDRVPLGCYIGTDIRAMSANHRPRFSAQPSDFDCTFYSTSSRCTKLIPCARRASLLASTGRSPKGKALSWRTSMSAMSYWRWYVLPCHLSLTRRAYFEHTLSLVEAIYG